MTCVRTRTLASLAAAILVSGCRGKSVASQDAGADADAPQHHLAAFAPPVVPAANQALVDLGSRLFFDPRLSGDGTMSCSTCHDPQKGFSDGLPRAKGRGGKTLTRNSPSVVNVDARTPMFWDGRAATPEEQALMPVTNPDEMGQDVDKLIADLDKVPEYVARFLRAFGDSAITEARIGKALAAFERTLVSAGAPFDRYLGGDKSALSKEAEKGLQLFEGKGACVTCHDGPHLTDAGFHNIGIAGDDVGRFKVVPIAILKGAFKTPGLRDVELTAPYFHDGSAATLRDVVVHYNRGGVVHDNLDASMKPLSLTDPEMDALVAFLRALTGNVATPVPPRIPVSVAHPRSHSTRELMKRDDGMLDQLDKTIANVDAGHWEAVRAAVATLVSDAEELATLRLRTTKPNQHKSLKELLGRLVLDFEQLDDDAAHKDRPHATATYETIRGDCDACHDAFRWKSKSKKPHG